MPTTVPLIQIGPGTVEGGRGFHATVGTPACTHVQASEMYEMVLGDYRFLLLHHN